MSEQATPQAPHPGRPSKYTPQVVGKMLGTLQAGLSVESACEYAGINPDTHYQWLKEYSEYSEKVSAARMYGTLLAGRQIQDILQDIAREEGTVVDPKTKEPIKPKYSEATRATISKWWMEKKERKEFGTQSLMAAKLETNDQGGTTATIVHATDGTFTNFFEQFTQISSDTGNEEINPGQLLEVLEDSPQAEGVAGGDAEGRPPQIHPEELQGEHPPEEGMPQP